MVSPAIRNQHYRGASIVKQNRDNFGREVKEEDQFISIESELKDSNIRQSVMEYNHPTNQDIGDASQLADAKPTKQHEMVKCISTMSCSEAFNVQPALTKKYVADVLDLCTDKDADFTLSAHEFLPASDMDRDLLAEMANYIKEKLRGNTKPLQMDFYFDELAMQTYSSGGEHPASDANFAETTQESRLAHYNGVCRQVLQKHKWPLSCVAAPAATAAGFTQPEIAQFLLMVATHDFSKLAFPPFFCAASLAMVPGATKPLMQFANKDSDFFKLMFSFVQMHRLLEITHHQSVLKKTTGRLHQIATDYLEACAARKCRLTYLEIVCDTVEASLSRRCPTNDNDAQSTMDTTQVNPWVDFASKNFTEGKAQEIPEPALGGVLSLLFPAVAMEHVTSSTIMAQVDAWTTTQVRLQSPVFEAIYMAYDQAVLQTSAQYC